MNLGHCIKKVASSVKLSTKIYKVAGTKSTPFFDFSKHGKPISQNQLTDDLVIVQKYCIAFPTTKVDVKKNIIEPHIKIKVELPLSKSVHETLELPFHSEKEVTEPAGGVIKKEAVHIVTIRKRKMKKHKKKKNLRKRRIDIQTRLVRIRSKQEKLLQDHLKKKRAECQHFSPEKYVDDVLKEYYWERPVTEVRGRLAPDWVIKQHLEQEEERKLMRSRIIECQNYRKKK